MTSRLSRIVFFICILTLTPFSFAADDSAIYVTKFEFTGIKRTPPDELKKISAKYIHSPLRGEWPNQMIQELEKIPTVKEAYVIRDLTEKVAIRIIERNPTGYLSLDRYYWIDDTGNIIQEVPNSRLESMVFFSGPWRDLTEFKKNGGVSTLFQGLRFYVNLLRAGAEEKKISEIHFDAKLGWMMYRVESRAPIVFGLNDLEQKIDRFVQVSPHLDPLEGEIINIDADFHDRVVVKLASSPGRNREGSSGSK